MCLVCIDLVKFKMTITEAERNLGELVATTPQKSLQRHYKDLLEALSNLDTDILRTYFDRIDERV